jgi:hypothetical protein
MRTLTTALLVASAFTSTALGGDASLGCFTRTYDRAHLARHPDQLVTQVRLRIYRPPPDVKVAYWFSAQFRLRGRNETLRTGGLCTNERPGVLRCIVECDGGGVDVAPRADGVMMHLDWIRVAACGDDVVEGGERLSGGKDDRVFRLDRVDDRECAGMKP